MNKHTNLSALLAHSLDPATGVIDEAKADEVFRAVLGFEADIAAGAIEPPRGKRNARRRRATMVADVLTFMACKG